MGDYVLVSFFLNPWNDIITSFQISTFLNIDWASKAHCNWAALGEV